MGNNTSVHQTFADIVEEVYKQPGMETQRELMFEELHKYEALVFSAHQALLTGTKVPNEVVDKLLHLVFEMVYLKRKVMADRMMYAATYDSLVQQHPMTTEELDDDSDSSEDSEEYNSTCEVLFPNNPRQENGFVQENDSGSV